MQRRSFEGVEGFERKGNKVELATFLGWGKQNTKAQRVPKM